MGEGQRGLVLFVLEVLYMLDQGSGGELVR